MAPSNLRASAVRVLNASAITAAALALPVAVGSLFAGPDTSTALVAAALVLFTGAGALGVTAVMTRYSALRFFAGLLAAAAAVAGLFRALELWPVPTLTALAVLAAVAAVVVVARRIARLGFADWFAGVRAVVREAPAVLAEVAPAVVFISVLIALGGACEFIFGENRQDPNLVPLVAGSIIMALGSMVLLGWSRRRSA